MKLEKISDIDNYLFIKKGLKGGISYVAERYSEANNNYLKDYHINSLFGWAMSVVSLWCI